MCVWGGVHVDGGTHRSQKRALDPMEHQLYMAVKPSDVGAGNSLLTSEPSPAPSKGVFRDTIRSHFMMS